MKYAAFFLIALGASLSTSCVNLEPSPDMTKLYTLGPVSSFEGSEDSGDKKRIYISRPNLPVYLSGSQLAYREADGELKALGSARWAEPIEEGLSRALAEFIAAEASDIDVYGYYPWVYPSRDIPKIKLHVYQLSAYIDGRVVLEARWEISSSDSESVSGLFRATDLGWSKGDASSLVAAWNEGIRQLAIAVSSEL
ncbi:MAG: ABC-type transport auxiliary lipoprotein family protein [Verrucomicrobiota bacterium]